MFAIDCRRMDLKFSVLIVALERTLKSSRGLNMIQIQKFRREDKVRLTVVYSTLVCCFGSFSYSWRVLVVSSHSLSQLLSRSIAVSLRVFLWKRSH